MYVIKRDNSKQEFDEFKISNAVKKAFFEVEISLVDEYKQRSAVMDEVMADIKSLNAQEIHIETIQDMVEKSLMKHNPDVAKAFILYREKRAAVRDSKAVIAKITSMVDDYIKKDDWRINENSNMDYSLQGLNNHLVAELNKHYWLNNIYPESIRKHHEEGDYHIHDLGSQNSYCAGWDLEDFLLQGMRGVYGKVVAKPPKHFRTALGQLTNILYTLQGEWAGAQAVNNFDTLLAPFIRYDKLTFNEVKQSLQEFIHNMNVPTRVGFQSVFSNITLDIVPTKVHKDKNAIIGGKRVSETFGDFQEEMDMINIAFAEIMLEGDGVGKPFPFPIPTYNVTKDFPFHDDKYRVIWKMASKYGTPYFANFYNPNTGLDVGDAFSMCPLAPDEEVIVESDRYYSYEKVSLGGLNENKVYNVLACGEFVKAKPKKYTNQKMLEVELFSGQKIKMTETHLNLATRERGSLEYEEIVGRDLKEGFFLPFSRKVLQGVGGDYEAGFFVGCYAGDGSLDDGRVVFSLSKGKKENTLRKLTDYISRVSGNVFSIIEKDNLVTLSVYSESLIGLCKEYVEGIKTDKTYKVNILNKSLDFRRGLYEGHYSTDGGNRRRIYTSSKKMVQMLGLLANSLGIVTNVREDNREGRYSNNPNYIVRFYNFENPYYKTDNFYVTDEYIFMKIVNIKPISGSVGYCLEVLDVGKPPLFMLANSGVITHNCRLRLNIKELNKRNGGLFGSGSLTGGVGVVTINLPSVAYKAAKKGGYLVNNFFSILENLMDSASESLEIKRKYVEKLFDAGLFPYSKFYLRNTKKRTGKYLTNHFSTIGLVGMNEACLNLFNKDIVECKDFVVKVLKFMREKVQKFQDETGNVYNLEATPAESTAYSLALKDKKRFSDILQAGEKDGYYTNSTQLPVDYTDDIFEALEHQSDIQELYTGGSVLHLHLGEKITDEMQASKLIEQIFTNYALPYVSLSPVYSICPTHGYISGEHHSCPHLAAAKGGSDDSTEELKEENTKTLFLGVHK